jgi:hypothetical protein
MDTLLAKTIALIFLPTHEENACIDMVYFFMLIILVFFKFNPTVVITQKPLNPKTQG